MARPSVSARTECGTILGTMAATYRASDPSDAVDGELKSSSSTSCTSSCEGQNHHGSQSLRGTELAALFYTLCETAKLVGVDPHAY